MGISLWNVVLVVVSVILAGKIVHESKIPNIWIIPVAGIVFVLCVIFIWVLKKLVLLGILCLLIVAAYIGMRSLKLPRRM